MSFWYRRDELGIRIAVFFSMAALAGSFGGLLAAAISKMDGIGGKPGWAWIFILEGLATIIVGVSCWWMIPGWPDTARFLGEDDRMRLRRRLAEDHQSSRREAYDKRHIFAAFMDWKTWGFGLTLVGAEIALYAFSLFLPTILAGLGHAGTQAQLLSVPPYACAAVVTVFIGWLADRTRCRGYCNMGAGLLGAIGFVMLISTPNPHVQYAGTFLAAMGIYPTIPNTSAWVSNNIEGVYKRGVVIGIVVCCGNINGIVSSNIYFPAQKPRYWTGHGTVLAALTLFLFGGSLLMHVLLRIENTKRLTGKRDRMLEGKTAEEIWIAGDNRPDFIYTL
jgi:sugar phosphate permease